MTDGIIKGTGNSRFLKSVANAMTLYPTHEALMEALVSGTFPIDLNGINPAGWETVGNKLDKATLLADATATGMGLTAAATPNTAFAKLRQLIQTAQAGVDNGVKTQIVSYVGTGKYGFAYPCSITFLFVPKAVFFVGEADIISGENYWFSNLSRYGGTMIDGLIPEVMSTEMTRHKGFGEYFETYGKISADKKTYSWYSSKNASQQLNEESSTYYFMAISA